MSKRDSTPRKTTINLAQTDHNRSRPMIAIPAILIMITLIASFVKVGIMDQLSAVSRVKEQVGQKQISVIQLQSKTDDYSRVNKKYQTEVITRPGWKNGVDPLKSLALIETDLINNARISSFTITSSTITVRLSGVTLNDISSIYQQLMKRDMVDGVQVYTASAGKGQNGKVTADITIRLRENGTDKEDKKREAAP